MSPYGCVRLRTAAYCYVQLRHLVEPHRVLAHANRNRVRLEIRVPAVVLVGRQRPVMKRRRVVVRNVTHLSGISH